MKTAFIVFEGMTALDFVGFYDPVTRLATMKLVDDFEWRICSLRPRVSDDRGLTIEADSLAEPLDCYDLVFVPGGFGTRSLQHDRDFIAWLKTAGPAPLKVSVCTGALLLGAAGFLRGRRTVPMRVPSPALRALPSLTMRMAMARSRRCCRWGRVRPRMVLLSASKPPFLCRASWQWRLWRQTGILRPPRDGGVSRGYGRQRYG